jgi:cytochrome b561
MLKNTTQAYGIIAKSLHWSMAILIVGMFVLAYTMMNLPDSAFKFSLYNLHKSTGLLLWAIFFIRLVWLFTNHQPGITAPVWQQRAAFWNKVSLYLLMFAMPTTGFFMSTLSGRSVTFFSLFTIEPFTKNPTLGSFFHSAHVYLSYFLIAAFVIHVLGALYHHFILKDDVLKRIR